MAFVRQATSRVWPGGPVLLLALLLSAPAAQCAETLIYPRHSRGFEPEAYALALLTQALERSPGRYRLQASADPMTQSRALMAIEQNGPQVQVTWSMTSIEREARLLPVRIPIYRGLIGWRVILLRSADSQRLAQVKSLQQLQGFSFGQRHDWPDTTILRGNGLRVITSPNYLGLFDMLAARRFDLLPRELVVAWQEQARAAARGLELSVDPYLLLHYPTAFYFFTAKQRPDLAADIERGLEAMLADGSFQRLFQQYHAQVLIQAKLPGRRIIELHNPILPPATPFARKELWYQPQETP